MKIVMCWKLGTVGKKVKTSLVFLLIVFIADYCIAGEINPKNGCKKNPEVVDKCFMLHGRISVYNGTPSVRVWQVGTKRLFGVLPSENEILPEVIKKYLSFSTNIYGDFLVCPFSKATVGYMQDVCVESASQVVVERYIKGKKDPELFRLKDNSVKPSLR